MRDHLTRILKFTMLVVIAIVVGLTLDQLVFEGRYFGDMVSELTNEIQALAAKFRRLIERPFE